MLKVPLNTSQPTEMIGVSIPQKLDGVQSIKSHASLQSGLQDIPVNTVERSAQVKQPQKCDMLLIGSLKILPICPT